MKKYIALFFLVSYPLLFANEPSYYHQHAKGWHWYEDPEEITDEDENQTAPPGPSEQMNAVRATIKQALDKAVLYPTKENVTEYITLQNQLMGQSSDFADVWKQVLLERPELDYSLVHPTNSVARQIEIDQENLREKEAIDALAKESGLFFFYHSSCPYCKSFAPVVKNFSERYHVEVTPITTDGISLPEFPNSRIDQGQADAFQVKTEPALFAVNPYTHEAYPVSYGMMSETDLKKRILEIATRWKKEGEK